MLNSLLLLACVGAASAIPRVQTIDANYDDITVVPAVPAANTLNTYKGLTYKGFAVNQVGVAGAAQVAGVKPHSNPNVIVSGVQQTANLGSNPGFSTSQTSSKAFNLDSLYYGCSINTSEGSESLAQTCTLNVVGYRYVNDANPIALLQVYYTPKASQPLANMQKATFGPTFRNIQRVDIVQVESTSGAALNTIILDDVVYDLYT